MSQNICSRSPYLSIIIPARNEARRLPASLEKIADYLSTKTDTAEIIVVDNGSTDGTGEIVRQLAESHQWITTRLVTEATPGKGAAVRIGMLLGTGDFLFQCDADLSMPIEELDQLIDILESGRDLAIGCREGQGANRHGDSLHRRLMGRIFNLLVKTLGLSGLPDTQCGFKLFRREVAHDLFSAQTITGWGFDVEILVLARQRGYSVASVPIHWLHDTDSRVRPVRDGFKMFYEMWAIRNRLLSGVYGPRIDSRKSTRISSILENVVNVQLPKRSGQFALRRVA